jgi:hypothetical protein
MKHILFFCMLLPAIVCKGQASSQQTFADSPKTFTMPAGIQFKASNWKQFWWGRHWRPEWIKPVSFPVFDIDTAAGGLNPTKRGGGHQTKSLRLLSKDGKEYVLRTIDKDLELLIPEEFKGSVINNIVNDQISTAHPYGPLAIANLTQSIGSMHTNPVIVYVPDDPKLGEYRSDFANKLCLFEERPSGDGWEKTALTNYADDVVNTEKLYSKLQPDNDKKVDQHEFLKIRFLDMLVNDWDRHPDQWAWAGYKHNGKTTYVPFARDRDQAFSKTDGVNLFLLSLPWLLRSVRNMKANIHDVVGVNLAGVSLDKHFTNELTKEDWLVTIRNVQGSLTDSAIHHAVMQMPKEITDMSGDFVEKRLKQRRDNMLFYGTKYYKAINKRVTILGSDKDEYFTITKVDNNTTEITVQGSGKNNLPRDTIFYRKFTHDITKEINLYGFGDNDQFIYKGNARNRIFLRTIGGDGADQFVDSTAGRGSGKKSRIYDTIGYAMASAANFRIKNGADTTYTNYHRRSFKYDWWKPLLTPGYNVDDGFTIGLGLTYKKQEWHKYPFGWQQSIGGTFAGSTGSVGFFYKGIFKQVFGKWDFELAANYRAPKYVLNFYGYGNETKLNGKEKAFFRIRSSGFSINPSVSRTWERSTFNTGLVFQSVKIARTENKFISQPGNQVDSSVFGSKYFGGLNASYSRNRVVNKRNPQLGAGYEFGASYMANLEDVKRDFVNVHASAHIYIPLSGALTFAHRTGAATNIGDFEFYQANSIGGLDYLRGYWRTRFTGKTSFYQNTDLRLQLGTLKGYVFRGALGIYGFFDDGRVWVDNEDSRKIHTGYGGGVYFIPFNMIALNISYQISEEVKLFNIRAGFLF